MSKKNQIIKLQGEFVPHPISKRYFFFQKLWLRKNPWVTIGRNVVFPLTSKVLGTRLEIKDGTVINGPITVKGSSNVTIGKYCGIAENLFIVSSNHLLTKADSGGKFSNDLDISKGSVYIGNNVWVGDNVTILSGVTIGDGAAIGAGSIVTHDVPPFGLAVGSPARTIKYRFTSSVNKKLVELGWWHWSEEVIFKNKEFFEAALDTKNIQKLIMSLKLKDEKDFLEVKMSDKNSMNYLLDGWGPQESAHRWMLKETAGFILKVNNPAAYKKLSFIGNSFYKSQSIYFIVNGVKQKPLIIKSEPDSYMAPVNSLKKGVNKILIISSYGTSPYRIDKQSQDKRKLYCRFTCFKLNK